MSAPKVRRCRVCGCTEDNACQTKQGPCSWIDKDLCSACVVEVTIPRYFIPKTCKFCAQLIWVEPGVVYTCRKGRFDNPPTPGAYHHWFDRSGITRPNKVVGEAQRHCPHFSLRSYRVHFAQPWDVPSNAD